MAANADPGELYATADFCLIPMGLAEPSVAIYIAECQRVLEKSGLVYKVRRETGYGTNLEGPWSAVCEAIHACHKAVHAMGAPRIATDVRIGTRVDRTNTPGQVNEDKVRRVDEILTKDSEKK
ncbi:hypothetical protein M422DRAFT_61971 [Sphaerobolus stellatus SS14]|uniref:Thiamine-binding protein domain-containing protein n=1 Tax=Sphaerobolus stellatus (strain SS14) TaxID=990650 RepID=A0A0C9TER9_SPHS4|nr:hypothetical protein M422DRAFT_61971 [Sphaerobolus stellatus SS14]